MIDINKSGFSFEPDVENNEILFGLKGLLNVGDEVVDSIIENRPYSSPKDFIEKVKPKKSAMISLIKSGAFDKMVNRRFMLAWYIYETCDKKKRVNLQNMNGLITNELLPTNGDFELPYQVYEFNRYLKSKCKTAKDTNNYYLDVRAINFLNKIECSNLINSLISPFEFINNQGNNQYFILNVKSWDKVYQKYMDIYRTWMSTNQDEIVANLNYKIFKADWDKYATCASPQLESAWEMEVMCFYYHQHELANIDPKYGYEDFAKLSPIPEVDKVFYRKGIPINLYKLTRICGTCIAKNKTKSTVTLLTSTGVVTVKFRKEYFSLFDKQISVKSPDGKKKIVERSWFNRGNMIVVNGMRRDNDFVVKKYSTTNGHQLYKIDSIDENGQIVLRSERQSGEAEESED